MADATIWQGPSEDVPVINVDGNIFEEVQVAAAGQTLFTLTSFEYTPGSNSIFVWQNGVMLRRNVEYTETSSTEITLAAGAVLNDELAFISIALSQLIQPTVFNGLPPGGTAGQILEKINGSDYAAMWSDPSTLAALSDAPRVNVASGSTIDLLAIEETTRNIQITGTVQIDGFQITDGQVWACRFDDALVLKNNASIVTQTGNDISTEAGATCFIRAIADNVVEILCYTAPATVAAASSRGYTRQTVQSGPYNGTTGAPDPGGATGATSVTTTNISAGAPWIVNAAGDPDRIGISTANLTYTGLSVNGTMYLYNDIAADGTITPGAGTLAPTYQEGGARSTTNGQMTYNIAEMSGTVGNGVGAVASYRVYVGEVTVAAGVVSAIIWYAYNGRYDSGWTATIPAAAAEVLKSHNIGVQPETTDLILENTVADAGYAVGARIKPPALAGNDASGRTVISVSTTTNVMRVKFPANIAANSLDATGNLTPFTAARWKYKFLCKRGW